MDIDRSLKLGILVGAIGGCSLLVLMILEEFGLDSEVVNNVGCGVTIVGMAIIILILVAFDRASTPPPY